MRLHILLGNVTRQKKQYTAQRSNYLTTWIQGGQGGTQCNRLGAQKDSPVHEDQESHIANFHSVYVPVLDPQDPGLAAQESGKVLEKDGK